MILTRVSSSRSNYARGGLVFAEPQARRVAGGRLAFDMTVDEIMALGIANVLELRRDPAIAFEVVDPAGARHAAYKARQRAHQASTPHRPLTIVIPETAKPLSGTQGPRHDPLGPGSPLRSGRDDGDRVSAERVAEHVIYKPKPKPTSKGKRG